MRPLLWTSGKFSFDSLAVEKIAVTTCADYMIRYSGTRFVLSRDELLTLPEFVLLSLFPNGLFPEGHMGGLSEGDAVQVDVSAQETDCPL